MRRVQNSLAAYQLDNAVLFLGVSIENAVAERRKVSEEYLPKYTIDQLLEPDFRLPSKSESFGGLRAIVAANPGIVGRFKEIAKAV